MGNMLIACNHCSDEGHSTYHVLPGLRRQIASDSSERLTVSGRLAEEHAILRLLVDRAQFRLQEVSAICP
jgi:hypothetical protein